MTIAALLDRLNGSGEDLGLDRIDGLAQDCAAGIYGSWRAIGTPSAQIFAVMEAGALEFSSIWSQDSEQASYELLASVPILMDNYVILITSEYELRFRSASVSAIEAELTALAVRIDAAEGMSVVDISVGAGDELVTRSGEVPLRGAKLAKMTVDVGILPGAAQSLPAVYAWLASEIGSESPI